MVLRLSYAPRVLACVYCGFRIIHVHLEHNLNPAALTLSCRWLDLGGVLHATSYQWYHSPQQQRLKVAAAAKPVQQQLQCGNVIAVVATDNSGSSNNKKQGQ